MGSPGRWVRHRRRAGAHGTTVAPPIASGVTVHADEHPADDVQEIGLLASVPVTGGHWSPLAEGEIVVVSDGKLIERAGMQRHSSRGRRYGRRRDNT